MRFELDVDCPILALNWNRACFCSILNVMMMMPLDCHRLNVALDVSMLKPERNDWMAYTKLTVKCCNRMLFLSATHNPFDLIDCLDVD